MGMGMSTQCRALLASRASAKPDRYHKALQLLHQMRREVVEGACWSVPTVGEAFVS